MDVKEASWRGFSSLAKLVTLFEALVISFLSFWLYEESLANPYMGVYVNQVIQTEGLTIATLAFVIMLLGGLTSLVFFKSRGNGKRFDAVSIIAKIPTPALASTSTPASTPTSTGVSAKPSPGLHPVVAALKAELSGAPASFGSEPVGMTVPRREEVQVHPGSRPAPVPPVALPAVVFTGPTPHTVITGAMPVLSKMEAEHVGERFSSSTALVPVLPSVQKVEVEGPMTKKGDAEKKLDPEKEAADKASAK